MKNGNALLDIEIVEFHTELINRFNGNVEGWSGSVKIENQLFSGDFSMTENYTFDGEEYEINWHEII